MVLRQGKRRIFLACSGYVCVMADTRHYAANHSPTHYGNYPCRLFCGGTGFQTARLDVLVSRRRQRADACRFRRQPVCQTNGYRTPRPTATPRPSPEGVRHTRRVTQIWCAFFVFNGATAAILAGLQYYDWWAAYTGIVSYVLMGILFAGEWIYRKLVLKV